MKGRFALYEKPDGAYHLTYREDDGDIEHVEIPALYVNFFKSRGRSLMGMMKGMM